MDQRMFGCLVTWILCLALCTALPRHREERDQPLPCPIVSKGTGECFVDTGDCQYPETIFNRCLNPMGYDDPGRIRRDANVEGEASLNRDTRSYCPVFEFKGSQCYYRPMMKYCQRPPNVQSKCVQGYGRTERKKRELQKLQGLEPSVDAPKRRVEDSKRSDDDSKRSDDSTKRSDGKLGLTPSDSSHKRSDTSVERRGDADNTEDHSLQEQDQGEEDEIDFEASEGSSRDRVKRTVYYYYGSDEYYDVEPDECRVYKIYGRNCYWRPVGNGCVPPRTVAAKCLTLPDSSEYIPI